MKISDKNNIKKLDEAINFLIVKMATDTLTTEELEDTEERLAKAIKYRTDLYDSKAKGSVRPAVVSGIFGLVAVLVTLHHEKLDVITSKAFSVATRMIEG